MQVSISSGFCILDSLGFFHKHFFASQVDSVCAHTQKTPCGIPGSFPVSKVTISTPVPHTILRGHLQGPTPLHCFLNSFLSPPRQFSTSSGDLLLNSGSSACCFQTYFLWQANCRSVLTWDAPSELQGVFPLSKITFSTPVGRARLCTLTGALVESHPSVLLQKQLSLPPRRSGSLQQMSRLLAKFWAFPTVSKILVSQANCESAVMWEAPCKLPGAFPLSRVTFPVLIGRWRLSTCII